MTAPKPQFSKLPPLHFALSLISEFAPNSAEALAEFSELYSGKSAPPSGYLNDVAVWQMDFDQGGAGQTEDARISFQSDRISFRDNERGVISQIKTTDAIRALPGVEKAGLTQSELRLALMLAAGLTLQEAAALDGTAYQTKRTQLKSVFGKTGHAKQHTLAGEIGSELASFFEKFHRAKEDTTFHWRRYAKFLPQGVRAGMLFDRDGEAVPYLEYGPSDGAVTFVLHPFIFPRLEPRDVSFALQSKRRFIFPIRPGALGRNSQETETWSAYVADCVQELALCFDTFATGPADIVALVSSGPIGAKFAESYPTRVAKLSFAATCYPPGFAGHAQSGFWSNVMELLSQDNYLGHSTVKFVGSLASQPDLFKQGILSSYQKNELDQTLIKRELQEDRLERVMFATLESYRSIAHDFKGLAEFDWSIVAQLPCRTMFIHGRQDEIHDFERLEHLVEAVNAEGLFLVKGASQWTEGDALRGLLAVSAG